MTEDSLKTGLKKSLKRKDRVYQKLKELTESLNLTDIDGNTTIGFEASFIGRLVGVSRNNTSKELNRLLKEGKVLKIKGKPVLYLDRVYAESKWNLKIVNPVIKLSGFCNPINTKIKEGKLQEITHMCSSISYAETNQNQKIIKISQENKSTSDNKIIISISW